MADAQLSVTRRALLAGAPLFPLILSGAEPGRSAGSKDAPLVKGEGGRSWPNFRLTFEPSPPRRPEGLRAETQRRGGTASSPSAAGTLKPTQIPHDEEGSHPRSKRQDASAPPLLGQRPSLS